MTVLLKQTEQSSEDARLLHNQREQVKQELRRRIQEILQCAKDLPHEECLNEIKTGLLAIQIYCESIEKTFIFIEEKITCGQYDLGGCHQDTATLFRGPNITASVAICVTQRGSLLHRNGSPWTIYRDEGDVNPVSGIGNRE
ncbi:MAG: hypothetical protein HC769_25750 [Cyanobacteria bacterium CRU_2_1]|nr:hypothetical protein [Cyanobacteria bacterium RU_5_0]NJR61932.1 hypothetical protein [Cyanobacteria bacterium CRU_2_1]